nr:DNA methyltransferase [Streptobacillus moniliformis]
MVWTPPKGRFARYSKEKLLDYNNKLYFNKNGGVDKKTYLSEVKQGVTVGSVWSYDEVRHTHANNEELSKLLGKGVFNNPKGTRLIEKIIKVANLEDGDIILDYHLGSGTTIDASIRYAKKHEKNISCIGIKQMDYIENIILERINSVISEIKSESKFVYCELLENAKILIE